MMFTSVFHAGYFDAEAAAAALIAALMLGLVIGAVYRLTCDHAGRFSAVLAVMPFLIAVVIMIVNGNLGTSVAVLGAFGLVRFRSAAGSAWEIAFMFFAMACGLACGMGFITLALIITAAASVMLFVLDRTGFGKGPSRARELKITIPEDLSSDGLFDDILQEYARDPVLRRIRTTNMGTMYELVYSLELRDERAGRDMIDRIRCRNGNLSVSLGIVEREKNAL